jgi:pyruvate kinase
MMMIQPIVPVEPKSAERTFASSHTTAPIPAAWRTPLHPQTQATPERENTETTTTPLSKHRSDSNPLPKTYRKTKIIATVGPASENGDVLRSLLDAGVSVFRLDLLRISRESAIKAVYALRSISTELQRPVSLVLETQLSLGRAPDAPAISESDWADLRFGLECGVDWLAVSAGRDGEAVRQTRQFLTEQKRNNISILARLENPSDLVALDQIIEAADGIILGGVNPASECSGTANLIYVQKCVSARKLVVISTGANAGVTSALSARPDALLLVEEPSVATNPLQSVRAFDGLIRREESNDLVERPSAVGLMTEADRAIAAALQQANEIKAEAIVVLTRSGYSAALCAALRPRESRVFVFTPDARLARRLRLRYALEPIVLPFGTATKTTITAAETLLRERKCLPPGAKMVFITDAPNQDQPASSMQVRELA